MFNFTPKKTDKLRVISSLILESTYDRRTDELRFISPLKLDPCKTEKLQCTCHFISHIGIHVRQTDGKLRFISSLILEYVIQTVKLHFTQLGTLWGLLSIACPIRMSLYIFLLYYSYHLCFTCIDIYDLSAWGGCWFVVYIRFIYKFLNVGPFDYTAVAGSGKVGPVNQVNHTSWVAVVTPTDRPKSVRNRCVIELFCGVVCIVTLHLWHFCWYMGFVIGLSQISSFFSYSNGPPQVGPQSLCNRTFSWHSLYPFDISVNIGAFCYRTSSDFFLFFKLGFT